MALSKFPVTCTTPVASVVLSSAQPPTSHAASPYQFYWMLPVDSFLTVLVRMLYIVLEVDKEPLFSGVTNRGKLIMMLITVIMCIHTQINDSAITTTKAYP